ncbi:MAG TPA: hypothetical protein DCY52_07365 [Methylococcaceae bacterium]|nr:hypothetical protein [Methylococcaceae bacterium]
MASPAPDAFGGVTGGKAGAGATGGEASGRLFGGETSVEGSIAWAGTAITIKARPQQVNNRFMIFSPICVFILGQRSHGNHRLPIIVHNKRNPAVHPFD